MYMYRIKNMIHGLMDWVYSTCCGKLRELNTRQKIPAHRKKYPPSPPSTIFKIPVVQFKKQNGLGERKIINTFFV
jgi:hypothetical protein